MASANEHHKSVEILFDGSTKVGDFETSEGAYIMRVQVDQRLDSPDYFSVQLQMASHTDFTVLDKLKPGMEVEIKLGYSTKETLFKGEVSYLEPHFSADDHYIVVSGYDLSHRLTRGTSSRTWGDGHKEEIQVGGVAGDVISQSKARKGDSSDGLSGGTDQGDAKHVYIAQYRQNDYEFLRGLGLGTAITIDSQSAEDSKKLDFKAVDTSGNAVVTICRENLDPIGDTTRISLVADFQLSTVQQVALVEVRGWDPKEKKPLLGKAEAIESAIDGTAGNEHAGKAHYGSGGSGRVLTIVDCPVASQDEADEVAKSIFESLTMQFCSCNVSFQGIPSIKAGDVVEMKQFGTYYDGKYLIEAAQHLLIAGAKEPYITRLKVVRNSAPEPA